MSHPNYRDIISGARGGIVAGAARCGLAVLSVFYRFAVALRNGAFDRGLLRVHRAAVPVVSIGNLTTGGTGKTPMVAALADWFLSHGVRPVILSRGYRAIAGTANDEKLVLDQLCPNVVHLQGADRARSATEACLQYGAHVLILDDGFQHRRLARDLDIVLIDALDPWGFGRLLPRGLLREPRAALRRADLVVVTRADQTQPGAKRALIDEIRIVRGDVPLVEAAFQPTELINAAGQREALESLSGPIAAFCGIGNPEGFRKTLSETVFGSSVLGVREFPDHHHYTTADLDRLADWGRGCGASALITTQKDLVKIPRVTLGELPLWAVAIRAKIVAGGESLESALRRLASRNNG